MAYLWPTLPHPLSTNTPIFLVASLRPLFVQHIGGQKSYASDNPFSSVPSASLFFKSFQLTFQCAHLCHLKKKKKITPPLASFPVQVPATTPQPKLVKGAICPCLFITPYVHFPTPSNRPLKPLAYLLGNRRQTPAPRSQSSSHLVSRHYS